MTCEIIKITAIGCNLRLMTCKFSYGIVKIRISQELYCYLKGCGVPTAQSLRGKDNES